MKPKVCANHLSDQRCEIGSGLQKTDKLLKRSEFVALSRKGRSISDRYFIVAFRSNDLDKSRLGITVTKKTGNAVVRNRIKRVVREFYRLNRQRINGRWDINVIAKKAAADVSTARAHEALRALVDRMGEG